MTKTGKEARRERPLMQRVGTGMALAVFALAMIFLLPSGGFALVAGAVFLLIGGWEAAHLAGIRDAPARLAVAAGFGAVAGYGWWHTGLAGAPWVFAGGCLLWLPLLAWLGFFRFGASGAGRFQPLKLVAGAVILLPAWAALVWLQARSAWYVLLLVVIIAAADTGAYFTGRTIGGTRLAPQISPGKTRAGAYGGLVSAGVLTMAAAALMPVVPFESALAGVLAIGLAGISIGGDLVVSLLKRHAGIKHASRLLPGHGGLLDRIDSLCAALPFYALAVWATLI